MSIRLLVSDSHLGDMDRFGYIYTTVFWENYLKYLLSCDGFMGFETHNGMPVDLPHKTNLGRSPVSLYRFTNIPSFVVFDTEDNALLYKLGLPPL